MHSSIPAPNGAEKALSLVTSSLSRCGGPTRDSHVCVDAEGNKPTALPVTERHNIYNFLQVSEAEKLIAIEILIHDHSSFTANTPKLQIASIHQKVNG
jgi:hypothetical protein